MGSLQAQEMHDATDPITALRWHLQSNHFPPVPESMVGPCVAAIDAVNEGRGMAKISLPDPVTYRGETEAPAYEIVRAHHLDPWLIGEDW
jgi:hypothetical protein